MNEVETNQKTLQVILQLSQQNPHRCSAKDKAKIC